MNLSGVTLLFNEPPDARKPDVRWRLYVFKAGEVLNGKFGRTWNFSLFLVASFLQIFVPSEVKHLMLGTEIEQSAVEQLLWKYSSSDYFGIVPRSANINIAHLWYVYVWLKSLWKSNNWIIVRLPIEGDMKSIFFLKWSNSYLEQFC